MNRIQLDKVDHVHSKVTYYIIKEKLTYTEHAVMKGERRRIIIMRNMQGIYEM